MKEPRWETATEKDVWEFVAWHLAKNGIQTLLVGGAVVAIYSEGAYQSGDLDFVQLSFGDDVIPKVMDSIGFKKSVGRHYIHPRCQKFPFNQRKVKDWCASEGAPQAFNDFIRKLKNK